jgi:polyhydroxyalkanoate synthesis regulator phasin
MAATTRRGWSKFSPEEKIQALWQDLNSALDDIESQEKRIKALEKTLATLSTKR